MLAAILKACSTPISFPRSYSKSGAGKNATLRNLRFSLISKHVAERYDLNRDITFDTRVEKATFDEDNDLWVVETDESEVIRARYFIMSVGCLSAPIRPKFDGENDFRGEIYQTSLGPKEPVDFTGKRVGIIGSGSSAIQSAPLISQEAAHVYLYQRRLIFVPSQNRPLRMKTST